MRIFISAGEPSGDLHGANLALALKKRVPGADLVGFGGERMAAAGVRLMYPLTDLAVMWFGRVLAHLPTFLHLGARAESYFRTQRPDAVVLIDYPGFHWHIAQRAQRYGVPVYYFVPPQLWAWGGWRVRKVRKYFRAVLTALPFEDEWYRSRGVRTHYVGHPYFDEAAAQRLDVAFMAEQSGASPLVTLLPGSRTQEVLANMPLLVGAAERIAAAVPGVRFAVAAYKDKQAAWVREFLAGRPLNVPVFVGRTPELIAASRACLAVSGSVSLELLARKKPSVIVYKTGRLFYELARRLVKVRYITLVNLLAGEALFPEFPTTRDCSAEMAAPVIRWLTDPAAYAEVQARLESLYQRVAVPGAVDRAADFLLHDLALSPARRND